MATATPGIFDQIHAEAQQGSGNIFDQIHAESQPIATDALSKATGFSPQPQDASLGGRLSTWASNVADDIKYGTDKTGVGTLLQKMGAHGVYGGVGSDPESAKRIGDFMASLPLGLAQVAKGAGEVAPGSQGSTWQGTKDIVGGAAQAGEIPSLAAGGPGVDAGADAAAAGASKIFGSVDRAGQLFNEVKTAAAGEPVEITDAMSQAASRAQELANAGAKGMPRVISKFVARVTDPDKAPIAWDEARDFYSNVSRLSANEYQSMNPQMAGAVGRFAGAFNDALQATAEGLGKGDEYAQAMDLYRTAKSWQRFGSDAWQGAKRALPWAVGGAGGAALGYQAVKRISDLMGE